jgi:hypothetical protein
MSEQERLNPADLELEAALKSLPPAIATIDPMAAAFAAGQRSCRRQAQGWQAVAAMLFFVGLGLWFAPALRPSRPEMTGGVDSAVATRSSQRENDQPSRLPGTDQSLLMLRAAVAEHGLDALPRLILPATQPIWVGEAIGTPR